MTSDLYHCGALGCDAGTSLRGFLDYPQNWNKLASPDHADLREDDFWLSWCLNMRDYSGVWGTSWRDVDRVGRCYSVRKASLTDFDSLVLESSKRLIKALDLPAEIVITFRSTSSRSILDDSTVCCYLSAHVLHSSKHGSLGSSRWKTRTTRGRAGSMWDGL